MLEPELNVVLKTKASSQLRSEIEAELLKDDPMDAELIISKNKMYVRDDDAEKTT